MSLSWADIFQVGTLVNLSITRWTASEATLARDLGIEDIDNKVTKGMTLGRMRLLDKTAFTAINAICTAARTAVNDHSTSFPMIPGAHFVSEDNVAKLAHKLSALKPSFDEAVTQFIDNVDTLREEQMATLQAALSAACHSTEARDRALARLKSVFPTKTEIRNAFSFSYSFYTIAGKKGLEMNLAGEEAQVKSVVGEMAIKLRQELSARIDDMIAMVTKAGKIPVKSLDTTRRLVAKMRSLNIFGDGVLDAQCDIVDKLLNTSESLSEDDVQITLTSISAALGESVDDVVNSAEERMAKRRFVRMSAAAEVPVVPLEPAQRKLPLHSVSEQAQDGQPHEV